MPNTAQPEKRSNRQVVDDEDDTLREVGEDHEYELEDEVDPADRRRDPLRQPH
ncbi:MAG TPA: hypothetical protein VER58_10440 [Thermoanaerobaculia bacterium]|nr:hypothetical protein [Thermoanaerobaculia bacterium]